MTFCPSHSWEAYHAGCEMPCAVCQRDIDNCDCPECPNEECCGEIGNPKCFTAGHLPYASDSIESFCDHIGVSPLSRCLRAIDKHNGYHIWIVLHGGNRLREDGHLYYQDASDVLDGVPAYTRIKAIGLGGIAWDSSDWEFSEEEASPDAEWKCIERMADNFNDALAEHNAMSEDE